MDATLWVFFGTIIIIVLIIAVSVVAKAAMAGVHNVSSDFLITELKDENARILAELASINENLASINKMLKEID